MWYDDLPDGKHWNALWSGLVLCGQCGGIRSRPNACPACSAPAPVLGTHVVRDERGREIVVHDALQGAEGRYEDYVYLAMLEREWKRSEAAHEWLDVPAPRRPSSRAAIVLLFWTYFETRIERLLRAGLRDAPERLVDDVLSRYSSIGARLDRLYKIVFDTTYDRDLAELGFGDVADLLHRVQRRRNAFTHGDPQEIDDTLVSDVVGLLKREHDSWVAVFNRRGTRVRR